MYGSRLKDSEWFAVSSETYFLTKYVRRLATSLLHGGVSINTQ